MSMTASYSVNPLIESLASINPSLNSIVEYILIQAYQPAKRNPTGNKPAKNPKRILVSIATLVVVVQSH